MTEREDDGDNCDKEWIKETIPDRNLWLMHQAGKPLVYMLAKESYGIAWVKCGPTRGHVRQMAAVLGVELKQETPS